MTPQPQEPQAQSDPNDFTNQYNTPLPSGQQQAYQKWAGSVGQDPVKGKYDYDLQGAFLGGSGASDNGHLTDQFKKPNHPTFSDESQYHGIDGYVGGKWSDAGYQPSTTNLQFHSQPELQKYFATVEPGTPLLQPAPTPKPTGPSGNYRISDFGYRARPAAPAPVVQPPAPRKLYGQ